MKNPETNIKNQKDIGKSSEPLLCKNKRSIFQNRIAILGLATYMLFLSNIPDLASQKPPQDKSPRAYGEISEAKSHCRIMEIICSNIIEDECKQDEERNFTTSAHTRGQYLERGSRSTEQEESFELQEKVSVVKDFFEDFTGKDGHKTPLKGYEEEIVKFADEYDIDYKYVIAIGMKESRLGTDGGEGISGRPFRPYNAWGLMIDPNELNSWEEGIERFCRILSEHYIEQGLETPYEMGPKYCPPNSKNWANDVSKFMSDISTYEE